MNIRLYDLLPPVIGKAIRKIRNIKTGMEHPFVDSGIDKNIKTIFDIGANIGDVTLSAAKSFPNAKIYCFEPVSSTFHELSRNTDHLKDRVQRYNFGFSDTARKQEINITSFHGANSLKQQSPIYKDLHPHIMEIATETIELRTLDEFVESQGIGDIDIVKIDVEGVEKEVLEGGKNTFREKVRNVFVEISFIRNPRESSYPVDLMNTLYSMGFALMNMYDVGRYTKYGRTYVSQIDAIFSKNGTY